MKTKKAVSKNSVYPGLLELLPVSKLHVEAKYQRSGIPAHVKKIAAAFRWESFGAISVSHRGRDRYYVIDGQQRVLAAKLKGLTHVPCVVFSSETLEDEAIDFVNVNVVRRGVTAMDRFGALIVAKDPLCLQIKRDVESTGYRIAAGGHRYTINCVRSLQRIYTTDPKLAKLILEMTIDLADGEQVYEVVLSGLFCLERFLRTKKLTLDVGHLRKKLIAAGQDALRTQINKAYSYYDKTGPKIAAAGIAQVINSGKRSRRIPNPIEENGND